ncbi:hypothetical protein [Nonomuraea gerenzanensis]|uniref:Pycsar effector protein domain-containing protein n=1 Tax=Nonomuraea gerenzanensis TaxID=93944 RepID=A0A1M4EAZ2_9ACTN|nr:hypothetical protein [Nonomuraea gerenzanensis]UBU18094.1 hypothetical protein LCN96_24640 [Nonomuraea gerenzanensis]SBO95902.1 hypothetical protein BN4615_P5418 [Nonomuraea gerenzanensis]
MKPVRIVVTVTAVAFAAGIASARSSTMLTQRRLKTDGIAEQTADAQVRAHLDNAIAVALNQIARSDTKANVLLVVLTLAATALGFVLQGNSQVHWIIKAVGIIAFALLAITAWDVLRAITPRMTPKYGGGTGFVAYAKHESSGDLLQCMVAESTLEAKAETLRKLSHLAMTKYKQLYRATMGMRYLLPLTVATLLAYFIW